MVENWLMVRIDVHRDEVPPAEALFERLGALVTWVEDAGAEPVLEPAPGETPLWSSARFTALMAADTSRELVRLGIGAALPGALAGITFSMVADRDWDAEWRRTLKPLRFGTRTWICPAGRTVAEPGAVSIVLEPGLAFGTGTHATTAMCLTWLDGQPLSGKRLLDYGCGSGILAVTGLALGAAGAAGVDIDPQALQASHDNALRNGLDGRLALFTVEDFVPAPRFDVIVANILSGILVRLCPELARCAAPGTRVALSGILVDQADEVIEAFRPWLSLDRTMELDGWVLLTGEVSG